jgi:uncharacterized membrane protein (UPF0127 family)
LPNITSIYDLYYIRYFDKFKVRKQVKLYNSTQNNLIAKNVKIAKSFITRSLGLIPRKDFFESEALIIKPCNSIHTFFMKFPIDVLFLDKTNKIIALYENVTPWQILPVHFNAHSVIELKAGQIKAKNIQKNDIIQVNE